jgi:hypothetical protein
MVLKPDYWQQLQQSMVASYWRLKRSKHFRTETGYDNVYIRPLDWWPEPEGHVFFLVNSIVDIKQQHKDSSFLFLASKTNTLQPELTVKRRFS